MRFSFILTVLLTSTLTLQALAQETPAPANNAPAETENAQTSGATEYQSLVATGIRRVALRDYARAADALRSAVELAPDSPEAHYYLACTLRQQGQLEDAVERFTTLLSFATANSLPDWQRRGSQGIAETLETIAIRPAAGEAAGAMINRDALQRAQAAWRSAASLGVELGLVDLQSVAETRLRVIDIVLTQEDSSRQVRTRIAEREAELAAEQDEENRNARGGR